MRDAFCEASTGQRRETRDQQLGSTCSVHHMLDRTGDGDVETRRLLQWGTKQEPLRHVLASASDNSQQPKLLSVPSKARCPWAPTALAPP